MTFLSSIHLLGGSLKPRVSENGAAMAASDVPSRYCRVVFLCVCGADKLCIRSTAEGMSFPRADGSAEWWAQVDPARLSRLLAIGSDAANWVSALPPQHSIAGRDAAVSDLPATRFAATFVISPPLIIYESEELQRMGALMPRVTTFVHQLEHSLSSTGAAADKGLHGDQCRGPAEPLASLLWRFSTALHIIPVPSLLQHSNEAIPQPF
jgi:hypothetical protein